MVRPDAIFTAPLTHFMNPPVGPTMVGLGVRSTRDWGKPITGSAYRLRSRT